MQHTTYTIKTFGDWLQKCLIYNKLSLASDICNIMAYYGSDYAESTFARIGQEMPEHLKG